MLLSSGGRRYCEKNPYHIFITVKQCRVIEESENLIPIYIFNRFFKNYISAQRQVQQAEDKVMFENEFIEHMQCLSSIQTDTISTSVITSSKEQRPCLETNLIFYCAQINEARKLKTLVYLKKNTVNEDSKPNNIF